MLSDAETFPSAALGRAALLAVPLAPVEMGHDRNDGEIMDGI